MAGAIAQGVIGKVTEMIVQQAAQEAALVINFSRDFAWLKEEFTIISDCLAYADSRAVQEKPIKTWLQRVRDVAWDAEDIVEECAIRSLYTRSCVCNPDELFFRYKMGKRIQEVKERIRSITEAGNQLKLFSDLVPSPSEQPSSASAAGGRGWKGNSLPPRDSHPVAIESKIQHLTTLMDESTVPIIAVVGMGGAGKTFLLQNMFHRIRQRYEHSIWLSISQSYSVHKLQCDLASHMGDLEVRVKDVSDERAAELIHGCLQGKKSLIVLDDVWRAAREDNIITSLGLPIGHESRCKVLVTTRNRDVCQNLGAFPYQMELLSEDESWQLFCAHAFRGNLPPDHLEVVASEIVKQCGRLPLALKITGASLSVTTEISQWKSKLQQLIEVVNLDTDPVIRILRLSYDSLLAALKPCFSYLSLFPEDEIIDCEYLINLWTAEGFIPPGEDQLDVAWGYLYQLANLCLLEVWEDLNKDLIKYCKIHDLLLDLAIDISKENRCIFAVENVFTDAKRILLAKKGITQSRSSCPRSLRTLSFYKNPIEIFEANFFNPMRLLRVLDLSGTNISTLPQSIGKLKVLKLLNLSETNIEEVPICVKSLESLVFLSLSRCKHVQRLPKWISVLKCLQHLNIQDCHDELSSHLPKAISELVSLRVLRSDELKLSVEDDGLLKLEDVAKLTCLQQLRVILNHDQELRSIENGILSQLFKMRHLSIASGFSIESHLPHNLTALQDLQTLCLRKFVGPSWVCRLTNLKQLVLFNCDRSDYRALETMPNLIELRLEGNASCRRVSKAFGKSSGFPKLRFLNIEDFNLLEELPDLEDGAMAVLERFHLEWCPRVKKVPQGLERLRRLKELVYYETGTNEFRARLNEGGEVWNKIKTKNPHVDIRG
ncbi:hypothetical protein SUGI_0344910 [Cryptomeria japonica]|uniref:disease resistance RPP13-like protein 4 n=1 Tax=Cryptomeria japonica TaxID=3369 RepID=UPI002408A0B2|nr:disease resistance RPP13-like protein 4 [Cryptomeria japonica]GLJ19199.1 hypothetical protein SUGI_0344910 [Cryptomeria japonica]